MIIPNRMKQSVRKVSSFKPQNINTLQSPGGFYTIKEEISTSYRKQETFNQKTILIADDTDSNRMYFQALLRSFDIVTKKHINVAEVQNGRDAYEFYKKEPSSIQLIMMDLNMPIMNGDQAAQQIRHFEEENEKEPRVYILGITGETIDTKFKRNYNQIFINHQLLHYNT